MIEQSHGARRRRLSSLLGAALAVLAWTASHLTAGQAAPGDFVGTWTGTSACVGDRPACKNETVVYRFLAVDGSPGRLRLLADKIIDGARVPMGALVCDHDSGTGEVRSEFRIGQTHGVWTFALEGDVLTGSLVILPERSVARDVKVKRAGDGEVSAAPPIEAYDG